MSLEFQRVIAVGFAAVIVTLTAGPAAGTQPGEPGRLAFPLPDSSSWETPWDIYVVDVDGSNRERLTTTGATSPAWSPTGAEIAYHAYENVEHETAELWIMDAMGGSRRLVEDRFWIDGSLEWSPDGSEILFFGALDGRDPWGLWAVSTVDRSSRLVMDASRPGDAIAYVRSYAWAPSGDWIAASVDDAGNDLALIDPNTGATSSFYCPVNGSIDWSPYGDVIVASGGFTGGIWLCDVEGSSLRQIVDGSDPDWYLLSNTTWSPDGESVLFTARHRTHGWGVFLYWMESEAIEQLFADSVEGIDWQPRQGTFWDDETSVFVEDIEWMSVQGITKGCNPPVNDKYCPDSNVTRGQMAAFLVRALNLTDGSIGDVFTDDDDSVFEADIEKLATAGITKGCNPPANDKFCPDAKVRREVMAAFLVRALHYTDDGGGDLFIDDDGSIFEADIDKLATAGVTRGCNPPDNDKFCPTRNVTRGQMAAFLHRALGD